MLTSDAPVPGYPEDRRSYEQRRRAAESVTGDAEALAGRVIARLLGVHVVIQDDNSFPEMPDIRIEYPDGRPAVVEVVVNLDRRYAEVDSHVIEQWHDGPHRSGAVSRYWFVTLSSKARIKTIIADLETLLPFLEAAGDVFEVDIQPEQHLDQHPADVVRRVAALGVAHLASRPRRAGEHPTIHLFMTGAGGPIGPDFEALRDWLSAFLSGGVGRRKRRKLAKTLAVERHLFVMATLSTPWAALHALSDEYQELPTFDPDLPNEVTHLWLCSRPAGRCLAWFPTRGWFEPSRSWATA